MNRNLFAATFIVVTISVAGVLRAAEGESLPNDVAKTIGELQSLPNQQFLVPPGADPRKYLPQAHEKFLELLKTLNGQVNDALAQKVQETNTGGIEPNLIAMARDYGNHPEHYEKLINFYKRPDYRHGPQPVAINPRSPTAEHTVEKYRPAWELLLLAPTSEQAEFMRKTCFEALRDIRSDASIPLLVFLFERASAAKLETNQASDDQIYAIVTLGNFSNIAGLQAMLNCMRMSEAAPPNPEFKNVPVKDWVLHSLLDKNNYGNGDQWRAVIENALREEKLSDADRSFLQQMLVKPASK